MAVYEPHAWAAGEPITADKVNRIEQGIANAQTIAQSAVNKNEAQDTTISEVNTQINDINNRIGYGFDVSNTIASKIQNVEETLSGQITEISQNTQGGALAWAEMQKVGVEYDSTNEIVTKSLEEILNQYATLLQLQNAYRTPSPGDTVEVNGQTVTVSSLAQRIQHIYNQIRNTNSDVTAVNGRVDQLNDQYQALSDSLGTISGVTLMERIAALDGGSINSSSDLPTRTIKDLINEIATAYDSSAFASNGSNATYNSLDARFEAGETRIVGIESEIADAHQPTAATLDARFDQIDGGGKPSRTLPNLISEVETARNGADSLNTRLNALDNTQANDSLISRVSTLEDTKIDKTSIENSLTTQATVTGKVLDARQGKILKEAIDGVNNEVTTARTSSIFTDTQEIEENGETVTTQVPHEYPSLDARLEAIESHSASVRSDINTIANELAMVDDVTHNIKDTNTKIDDLTADVSALASEISMGRDEFNRLSGAETRIDTLDANMTAVQTELNDARIQIGTDAQSGDPIMSTLDQRLDSMDAVTTNIINAIDHVQDENDPTDLIPNGLTQRITAAEGDIDDIENAISHTKDPLDANDKGGLEQRMNAVETGVSNAASASALGDLTTRVTTLENQPKSATVIIPKTKITYNDETGIPTIYTTTEKTITITPTEDVDYLLQGTDNKYYYWKYIGEAPNGIWTKISGGAGSGNTSGYDLTEEEYEELEGSYEQNTDYYVTKEDGVHHYRYILVENESTHEEELTEIEIGPLTSNIKRYKLTSSTADDKNYIDLYEFNYGVSTDTTDDGTRVAHIELVGGGSGGGTYNTKQITRISPRNVKWPINSDEKIYLRFFYTNGTANDSDYFTLTQSNATMATTVVMGGGDNTITSGDPTDMARTWPTKTVEVEENGQIINKTVLVEPGDPECPTGFYAFDITDLCKTLGKQTFVLTITDLEDSSIYTVMTWEITLINLAIESNFTQSSVNNLGQSINFTYTPSGDIQKTAHFYLNDGTGETEIGTQSLTARTVDEQSYTITGKNIEGAYLLRVQLTAVDNGNTIYSESIYRDIIWKDTSTNTIILSSPYRGRTIDVLQYSAIDIPYTIAGNSNSYAVKYYVNDYESVYNEIILTNTNNGMWTYRPLTQGIQNLRIEIGTTHIDFTLNVKENIVDINPYTTDLVLNFDPTGLSNNSAAAKQWTDGTYHLTVSNNFDWFNGGYGHDDTGDYFLIKSGTRAYFDYKMFTQALEQVETQDNQTISTPTSSVYQTGQEMKIIFKTSAVRSIDAVWFTNTGKYDPSVNTEVGIQLSAHEGWLKTNTASDEAVGTGDEQVAATNTYLYFPYSEEDRIELDININKESSPNGVFAMSYEDGVPSKAYAYTHNQILYQIPDNESIITIGSDDCDVYIYKLRIYNNELTPAQVLRNFIADGKTVDESIERYQRNCIYYDAEHDEYSPYATSGFALNAEALASKIPNVKVLMLDAPTFTLNKKSFIKNSTLRCIHAPGGTVYPSRGAADNWFFENGYHAGQGTTSDKYGDAGRNIDFLFNCDGTHKPSDKVKNPDPNYISQVTTGYGTASATTSVVSDWKGDTGKISLTSTSIPNNFFNLKVNIASSENVNNALLQKRYNDFLPYIYQSPAYLRDNRIKNDMEFVPAVLFVRENSTTEVHSEFNDTDWHFYALGNIGDSKKTDYTRAYDPTDMNEFTIEISDNNTNNSQFQTGVYLVNGTPTLETFEAVQDVDDDGKLVDGSFTAQGRSGAIATTDYVYPLDTPELKALWNAVDGQGNYTNKNHWSLVNEPYDGDHSFEMRYACCGDYRDGKMVNDTTGQGDAQRAKNAKVWQAFYSWVVTSSNEEFIRDLDQWCVRNAVEFWYAFTHYYTMMDNRAKNTFWHFAKTGIYRKVTEPIEDMLHVYVESNDATLVPGTTNEWTGTFTASSGEFDASNTYYTEYAFDLWDYDNDTALGIDNNGELIFPYGKEDSDYKIDGDASSGFVFNGAGSVFWRRLRDLCTSEISNVFHMATEQFFSSENLITQFDRFQECFPEALWQVDIQRKYIRPFTGDTSGGAKTRQSKRFLESMMQGRKKYQRRQWIKDQYYYFGSKYKLDNVTEDFFYLDCYTGPDDATIAELLQQGDTEGAAQYVGSNWDLTITPYQDMYINASFGETPKSPVRAKAGQPIEMTCPFTSMNNTRIYIYGASRLKALAGKPIKDGNNNIIGAEGLASLYIGVNSIEKTDKLQELYFGTDKTTYRNSNFTKLTLNENSPILETLDIRNCGSIAGELKLGGCNNLRVLEAEGTNITLVTLPSSSQITTLHLPSTVTSLTLSAARNLTDFYMKNKSTGEQDYSALRSVIIDNSDESVNINWLSITRPILNNLNYLYLLNLKTSSIANMSILEPFATRQKALGDNMNISGIIPVTGSWSSVEISDYQSIWNVTFTTAAENEQVKCAVTYKHSGYQSDSGWVEPIEIETRYIPTSGTSSETTIPDIYRNMSLSELPTRPSTIADTYQFGMIDQDSYIVYSGWSFSQDSNALSLYDQGYNVNNLYHAIPSVTELTLYTHFTTAPHTYAVKWYLDDDTVVKTVNGQQYGGGYNLEAPTIKELRTNGYANKLTKVTFNQNGSVTYKIFDGWQKLPTNINPSLAEADTNIYRIDAKWYEDTKPLSGTGGLFEDTTSPSLEQLLVLSRMSNTNRNTYTDSKNIVPTMKFDYQMGFDGTINGTPIINTDNVKYINMNSPVKGENVEGIHPFANNDGFTLVIDYKFDSTQTTYADAAVLVGCYDKNNGAITGFGLYNNFNTGHGDAGIRVGYGDMFSSDTTKSTLVGTPNTRNIVVLRHPKGSSQLWVYSSQPSYGNTTGSAVNIATIDVTTQTFSNSAVICLGNLRDDLATNNTYNTEYNNLVGAYGTIYWAKYWDEDLGAGECKQLAAWPHERMTAMIASVDTAATNDLLTRPSIYLTNLTASSHGFVLPSRFTATNEGWNTSAAKTVCDNRIFLGLPTRLQAMLSNPVIGYRNFTLTRDMYDTVTTSLGNIQSVSSIVYVPSISSLEDNMTDYFGESRLERTGSAQNTNSDITPYTWIGDASAMIVYDYSTTAEGHWVQATGNTDYFNLRFYNRPLNWSTSNKMRIFRISQLTFTNQSLYSAIVQSNTTDNQIKPNDIVIVENDAAYIYIPSSEFANYAAFTEPQGNTNSLFSTLYNGSTYGGWMKSTPYTTRSVSASSYQNSNFIYINARGETVIPAESSTQPGLLSLDYAFTI